MKENKNSGNGIALGAALGLAFVAVYGNSVSIPMGLVIGAAVGAIFDFVKK
ncbi:hypothetical protein [Emticicia sp.]|uniref:hypothetical protein n=1 Tax=Emticicia sp. TaxID=1930953 RepID=UPI003750379A